MGAHLPELWPSSFPWLSYGFAGPAPGFGLATITSPTAEPVTPELQKLQTRVDHDAEDSLIAGWIVAARRMLEQETGTRIVSQGLRLSLPGWPCDGLIRLGLGPVRSVDAVSYYPAGSGAATTLTADVDYGAWLDALPAVIYPAGGRSWPASNADRLPAVVVNFTAGMDPGSSDWQLACAGVMLLVTYWHSNRGDQEAPAKLGAPEGFARVVRLLDRRGYI